MRRLRDTLFGLQGPDDTSRSLQAVCDAVNDLLGCHIVVLSLVDDEGMRAIVYSGHDDGRTIMGKVSPLDDWKRMLDESQPWWGMLRFCRDPRKYMNEIVYRTFDDERLMLGDGDHWGSLNMLIAPMWSAEGDLVGAVTLDVEPGSALPDQLMCTILEMFTAQAGVAIHHQRLAERAAANHLALRVSEERYRLAFDNAPIGMTELRRGPDGLIVSRMNRAAARMLRVTASEVGGRRINELMPVVEGESLEDQLSGLLAGGDLRGVEREVRFGRADGTDVWAALHAAALPAMESGPTILCQILDITTSRATILELAQQATHDSLTGLPNRSVLFERLAEVVEAAAKQRRPGALLFCDLDNFKQVNDEHGHLVGDAVLAELARRLQTVARRDDIAGRFGGDEFMLVAHPLTLEAAKVLAERVSTVLSAPITVAGTDLEVQVSIGIAPITGTVDAAEVMRRADAAMYAAPSRRHRGMVVVDTF